MTDAGSEFNYGDMTNDTVVEMRVKARIAAIKRDLIIQKETRVEIHRDDEGVAFDLIAARFKEDGFDVRYSAGSAIILLAATITLDRARKVDKS